MPEWPDLDLLRKRLEHGLQGRQVLGAEVYNPIILRTVLPLPEWLHGRRLDGLSQRGKFLLFRWDDTSLMVVNPMLTGVFALAQPSAKRTIDDKCLLQCFEGRKIRTASVG